MKKIVWFVKENGKQVEKSIGEIISMTSTHKSLKITEYDIDNETHKVIEFKNDLIYLPYRKHLTIK
jgi:hypothetical protein